MKEDRKENITVSAAAAEAHEWADYAQLESTGEEPHNVLDNAYDDHTEAEVNPPESADEAHPIDPYLHDHQSEDSTLEKMHGWETEPKKDAARSDSKNSGAAGVAAAEWEEYAGKDTAEAESHNMLDNAYDDHVEAEVDPSENVPDGEPLDPYLEVKD